MYCLYGISELGMVRPHSVIRRIWQPRISLSPPEPVRDLRPCLTYAGKVLFRLFDEYPRTDRHPWLGHQPGEPVQYPPGAPGIVAGFPIIRGQLGSPIRYVSGAGR